MNKNKILLLVCCICNAFSYAQNPTWQWVRTGGSPQNDILADIAQDANGNVFSITSVTGTSLIMGPDTINITGQDFMLAKHNSTGALQWYKLFGGNEYDVASAITVDKFGDLYMTGYYRSDSIRFDTVTLYQRTNIIKGDIFLAKFSNDGNILWARMWGDTLDDYGTALTTDTAGNVYLGGYFDSFKMYMDSFFLDNLSQNTYTDGYVAKLNRNGDVLWANRFGNAGYERVSNLALDKTGNLYVAGTYSSMMPMLLPDTIFPFRRYDNLYLLKYNPQGVLQWGQSGGGFYSDACGGLAIDPQGNPVIAAALAAQSSITFGGQTVVFSQQPGYGNMAIVKYNPAGGLLWIKADTGISLYDLKYDDSGFIYVTGHYSIAGMLFDTINLLAPNPLNMLTAKLDNNGNALWALTPQQQYTQGLTISVNNNGSGIYVGGTYQNQSMLIDSVEYAHMGLRDFYIAKIDQHLPGVPISISADVHNPTCEGLNNGSMQITVSGGEEPYTYTWNNGNSGAILQNLGAGAYTVTVYDAVNDSAVYSTILTAHSLPQVTITLSADTVCAGDSIQLTVTATGNEPLTHTWSIGGNTIVGYFCYSSVSETILLTTTDANQCVVSDTITTTVLPLPHSSIHLSDNNICFGDSVVATVQSSGNGPFTHNWLIDGNSTNADSIYVYAPAAVGLYTTDANACSNYIQAVLMADSCTTVDIAQISSDDKISLYPNPAQNGFNIDAQGVQVEELSIYNLEGQIVQQIFFPSGNYINTDRLATGSYIAKVVIAAHAAYLKWVKE